MASDRRSSFGSSSIHSARRASSSSVRLPPLPPSTESLASRTSIPAPASTLGPIPPPKDAAPPPTLAPATPVRKPVMRQKSPLSNESYIDSPGSPMPGTFPATPPATSSSGTQAQSNAAAYPSPSTTTVVSANSKSSPKRPSSIRSLLSLKALRRSSNHNSPEQPRSPEYRPMTPGAESMASSSRPSLNKKRSGTFWRRKSSLGMNFGRDSEDVGSTAASPGGMNGDTVVEEESEGRSTTPAPGSDFPSVSKRKSGTFWRRRSSLGLAAAFRATSEANAPNQSEDKQPTAVNGEQPGRTNGVTHTDSTNGINGHHSIEESNTRVNGEHRSLENEKPLPQLELTRTRSPSPPPQLPVFVGGGGSLGMDDLLKDFE